MIKVQTLTKKWPIYMLGDCVDFLDHLRKPVKSELRTAGAYPYYGANGQQGTIDSYIFDEDLVLLAEDGGFFGQQGKTIAYKVSGKTWVNNHAHVLRPKKDTDVSYLCHLLAEYDVTPYTTGTTRAKLTKTDAQKIQIPLPPLPEQQRIATILDKANSIRQQRQESLALMDTFIKSVCLDMFGDPVLNDREWNLASWDTLFTTKTGKLDSNAMDANGMYPFFTCAKEAYRINTYAFDCEALLLAGNNAAGIYDVKYYRGKFNAYQRTYVLTLRNGDNSYSLYKYLLEQKLEHMRVNSRGTNTKYLTKTILDQLKFVVPPIELQNKFADIVQKVEAQKNTMRQQLGEAEDTFKALQQQFFG